MGRFNDNRIEGCCGNMIRYLLFIFNGLFSLLGLLLFILAAVLKWGNGSFNQIFKDEKIADELSSLSSISVTLMILGAALFLFSVFGFLGAYYKVKSFLVIYEIIVVLLFIVHLIAVLVITFAAPSIKLGYSNFLNQIVTDLGDNNDKNELSCGVMLTIATAFDCCGYNGPNDFKNNMTIAQECCQLSQNGTIPLDGCNDKSIDTVEKLTVGLLIIPSCFILAFELFVIIMTPFLIGKI